MKKFRHNLNRVRKFQLERQQQNEEGGKVEEANLSRLRKTEKGNKRLQKDIHAQNETMGKKEEKIISLEEVITAKEHENTNRFWRDPK